MHSGDTESPKFKKKRSKVQAKNIQLHVIFFKCQKNMK
jgi:hypothetical protein